MMLATPFEPVTVRIAANAPALPFVINPADDVCLAVVDRHCLRDDWNAAQLPVDHSFRRTETGAFWQRVTFFSRTWSFKGSRHCGSLA